MIQRASHYCSLWCHQSAEFPKFKLQLSLGCWLVYGWIKRREWLTLFSDCGSMDNHMACVTEGRGVIQLPRFSCTIPSTSTTKGPGIWNPLRGARKKFLSCVAISSWLGALSTRRPRNPYSDFFRILGKLSPFSEDFLMYCEQGSRLWYQILVTISSWWLSDGKKQIWVRD